MKTLCYSVRLASLIRISDKCYKATAFDGSEALLPSKFVFGPDYGVQKSEAYWISAWILERKELQYSDKKRAYFTESGVMIPETIITENVPEKMEPKADNTIEELKK